MDDGKKVVDLAQLFARKQYLNEQMRQYEAESDLDRIVNCIVTETLTFISRRTLEAIEEQGTEFTTLVCPQITLPLDRESICILMLALLDRVKQKQVDFTKRSAHLFDESDA
ncbi:hypothetical protein FJY94_03705 [Candidatus Kaiserbacteria bacterium]|nr:hypothetical protein [Candidatus Kaiserbacteria bacterium]